MMSNENLFGKRTWVKLWVCEWLDGTTRYEMTGAQRAFWIDLLAMAGRSRHPGIICTGYSRDRVVGYHLSHFQALDPAGELDIQATLQLFETCGKIRVEVTQETPVKLIKIEILNWNKYQSNLADQAERSRRYRKNKQGQSPPTASRDTSRSRHAEKSRSVTGLDGEVEKEREEEKTSSAPKNGARELGSPEFNIFWDAYPRKEGKKPALKAWIRLDLDSRLGEVLGGLEAWKKVRDPQFMPYAQGFLNQESWKDIPTGGKQDLANVRPAGNEPKSFDAARNEATDAAIRRILERSRTQPSQAGQASPPAIGRNGTADVHGGASRPAPIEIARRLQQGTPDVEENADHSGDPRVSKRAS